MVITVAVFISVFGVLLAAEYSTTVPILGLTLLVWFVAAWINFSVQYRTFVSNVDVTRSLLQGGREVSTAWAKVACRVRVTVSLRAGMSPPLVFVTDRVPFGFTTIGSTTFAGHLSSRSPGVIEYQLHPASPGILQFEGVALRLTDLCGFFYRRLFMRNRVEYLILPQLTYDEGRQRADKRFNILPPPGVHRLRRPGSGSELLDLRDYRPGDPPKMIAWKPSARRDRLITKEFESDVPVRCVLFLDTSQAVRRGPPGNTPLCRLVDVAAAIAQSAAGNRDFIGLTTFDETAAAVLRPARTPTHTMRLLGRFAEVAALAPEVTNLRSDSLIKIVYPVVQEIYPDLLISDINTRPAGMHWIPLLDSKWGWLILIPLAAAPILAVQARWFNTVVEFVNSVRPRFNVLPADVAVFFFLLVTVLFLPSVLALLFWIVYGIRGFFEPHRTHLRQRKQLAAVFASLDYDTPAAVERYLKDERAFVERASRFLADHRVHTPHSTGPSPKTADEANPKIDILASALLRSILAARDNELYVILADLTDLAESCEPLIRAVRVARTKHHHVLVIVPWPDGVPLPEKSHGQTKLAAKPLAVYKGGKQRLALLVQSGLIQQYLRRFTYLRTVLSEVGATVLPLPGKDAVRVVLDRLEKLRGVRIRR
jgi:uncharacterized protein (DUF58 family)